MSDVKEQNIKQEPDDELHLGTRLGAIRPQKRSWTRSLWNIAARLFVWYTILTLLFNCPSFRQDLTAESSRVCKVYFQVESRVAPYLRPYYQTYLGPVDDVVRPYAQTFHSQIYTPVSSQVIAGYEAYGAQRVEQAKAYGAQEWNRTVKPRLDTLGMIVKQQYQGTLGPYVSKAYNIISPPVIRAWIFSRYEYRTLIVPLYERALPHVLYAYLRVEKFVFEVGYPYCRFAAEQSINFIRRRVWPTLRIVYGQNVEPQLSKIRQRLSSYRDSKNMEAVLNSEDNKIERHETSLLSSSATLVVTSPSSVAAKPSSIEPDTEEPAATEEIVVTSVIEEVATSIQPSETPAADLNITDELVRWQQKFSRAADKGAEDLSTRVIDITTRQIANQVEGVGHALVTELMETSERATDKLMHRINRVVAKLSEEASEDEIAQAYEKIRSSIRSTGQIIKEKAQALRSWKIRYLEETEALVRSAADSTLDVIDNIRALGLQEIGMRWASMDSVSYKDWEEYHKLKKSFDDWRNKIESVAMDHEGLADAKKAAEGSESRGMDIAQDAALELARLKDVASWKIHARDSSQDFSDKVVPPEAARLWDNFKQKASQASEKIVGSTQDFAESLMSAATETAAAAASEASSEFVAPVSSSISSVASAAADYLNVASQPKHESATSVAKDEAESVATSASKFMESVSDDVESMATSAASSLSSATEDSSKITSSLSRSASSISEEAESHLTTITDSISSVASDASSLVQDGRSSIKSVAEDIKSSISRATESARSLTEEALPHHESSASSITEQAKSSVTEAAEKIAEEVDEIGSSISSQGSKASSIIDEDYLSEENILDRLPDEVLEAMETLADELEDVGGEATLTLATASSQLSEETPTPEVLEGEL